MDRVEGYIVDGVDERLVLGGWRLVTSVTFEGEVVGRILLFNISIRGKMNSGNDEGEGRGGLSYALDGYTPLNTAYSEPVCTGETGYHSSLPLEW